MRRCSYKDTQPTFRIQGFLGNRTMLICAFPNSPKRRGGSLSGLLRNRSPCRPFIAAIRFYSLNNRRILRHLLRLSNRYCTTVTPIFSPQFDFSDIVACSSAGFLLFFLLRTLAPYDYVIYCQAWGLSGHTSPSGESVCFFWTTPCLLKPKNIISFSRGRTLSGHTWSTAKKFSILDLSSLHPYGKPCLVHAAR